MWDQLNLSGRMEDVSVRMPFTTRTTREPFEKEMEDLSYSHRDVESIILEDEAFRVLKQSLRQRGCVTNAFLKENVHLYIQHVKQVRERREAERMTRQRQRAAIRRTRSNERPAPMDA